MDKRTTIAIAIALTIPVVMGIVLALHHPQKPVTQIRQAPGTTEFVGVGVLLRMNMQTRTVFIQEVISNTPAAEAGITSGQIVSKVDGVSLESKSLAECAGLLRGPAGSTVQLELITPDGSRTNVVELTRQKIKLR
jgi:C-terminal processing protease CtpA/Prc